MQILKKVYENLKKKGNEHLTLMIIPHNQSKIFHVQLTKFTIVFSLSILLTILAVSSLSWRYQENINPEVENLYSKDDAFHHERTQYMNKLDTIYIAQKDIQMIVESIIQQMNEKGEENLFLSSQQILQKAKAQIQEESKDFYLRMSELAKKKSKTGFSFGAFEDALISDFEKYLDESFTYNKDVAQYRKLNIKISQNIDNLELIHNFLTQEKEVRRSLPYSWPISGGHITSRYGPRYSPFGYLSEFHLGVDLADQIGTPIHAAADGNIAFAGYRGGYGRTVKIDHRFGYKTLYAHMSVITVYPGQHVKKGQLIGRVGQSGRATGPHLHFEVKIGEEHIDPMPFLRRL